MLAVDVDGTLMWHGAIDPADAEALRAAARAGVVVCLCTGRSWQEVRELWAGLALPAPHAPVICVGGALVVEPLTGRTLYSRPFDRPTADELAREIRLLGYPVMALVDGWREGFDYFLIGRHDGHPLYQRFFDGRACRVRWVEALDRTSGPRPLRISLLEERSRAEELVGSFRQRFAGRVEVQAIWLQRYDLHIVEAFAAGANKLTALVYVGQGYRIGRAAMAAIGDDYNDLPMLEGAGLSATTADAPAELRAAADVITAPRGERPVAQFVDTLLGRSGPQRAG